MDKKRRIVNFILEALVFTILPTFIGLILSLVNSDWIYMEVIYVVFGLLCLFFMVIRFRLRDSRNFKANKSIYEDHNTKEYKSFVHDQIVFALIGVFTLLLSLIPFLIRIFAQ